MKSAAYDRSDFPHSPLLVFYETTRACDLLCQHCRAVAQAHRHPLELSTDESCRLIEALAGFPKPPHLVFTGGDPIKRPDIYDLVRHTVKMGLRAAMTPSATPLLTEEVIQALKGAGLSSLAVSLDGSDAPTHDGFRGVAGSFARTLEVIGWANEAGLPVQINTTLTRHNVHQLDALAEMLGGLGIVLWSVFFLIPVGRASAEQRLSAQENEQAFETLYRQSLQQPYAIKTTEAPHYRRYLLQKRRIEERTGESANRRTGDTANRLLPSAGSTIEIQNSKIKNLIGTNDGRGVMFISHIGEIFPSGFLPLHCGKFPKDSPVQVYQGSPVFRALREADRLVGKCGRCEYRQVCGGSRARAYALSGDALGSDPDCSYEPLSLRTGAEC